ncbi:SEC7 domain-containing protein [Aphelenchoides besseyi]|nr:SEC7 domain-containing protein [Aphelenchoides besseyi]
MIKCVLALGISNTCKVHGASLLLAVRTCFNIFLATRSLTNRATAKAILTQIINDVIVKMETKAIEMQVDLRRYASQSGDEAKSRRSSTSTNHCTNPFHIHHSAHSVDDTRSEVMDENFNAEYNGSLGIKSVEEGDLFLIFRALCRLSEKNADNADAKKREYELLQSIILSLDMILLIVENVHASSLHAQHSFIFVVRAFLCKAITKHAASPVQERLSFPFWTVHPLVTITKKDALETLNRICADPQSLVDIYVNYDCHLTSANIFALLGGQHIDTTVVPQDEIKLLGDNVSFRGYENGIDVEDSRLGSNSETNLESINQFAQVKMQKKTLENGIDLFARKPKQGLKFLQEKNLVGTKPEEIAEFFHKEDRLDKAVIGDYLGEGQDFNKLVMHAYIDVLDFAGMNIVQALRKLLDKFRLPGESQKIDRLMEKFASRYCDCNPRLNIFASADTAYVLSYSIIMLATDLHSPRVRDKMTKDQYIAMNRGINDKNDLPTEFLSDIYDDIASNELKMKPGASKRPKLDIVNASYRQRKLFQNLELEGIAQTAHALMEQATYAAVEYTKASHYEHVRPMFELLWKPCIAVFSIGLQSSDDESIWKTCLEGFRHGTRVACFCRLNTPRDAYIQGLIPFTLLTSRGALNGLKDKNVQSIKTLIMIGDEDGNYLDERWIDVLRCVSQLEIAQHIGTSKREAHAELRSVFHVDEKHLSSLQERLIAASSQDVVVAVDRIFQGSSRLMGGAIVHFVRALCQVSHEELAVPGAPRMYMLQKIVDVSFYNMNRIRIEWSMIWKVLGDHFNIAGCSSNEDISKFALDALRQLSTKFLEIGELPNFRFQKDFFRPFEVIMNHNKSPACRDMIIACITNMVQTHSGRIRSGWKNIFSVLTLAAAESRESIVVAASKTTFYIFEKVFPHHFVEVLDSFQEAIKCLSEFACNTAFPEISSAAIRMIKNAATLVSENTDLINSHHSEDDLPLNAYETQKVWLKGWFPIIFELSCVLNRCKLDERTMSLTTMFTIIKNYGREFRTDWWYDLFKIVFRIFDFSKLQDLGSEKNEWMLTTCSPALYSIIDVFTYYYTELAPMMLPNIYQQFFLCVQHGSEQLARSAINGFSLWRLAAATNSPN